MSDSYLNTVKHTAIYGLGNISSKLVGFILLPLYTSYLSVNEYVVIAILEMMSQLLIGVFSLNIHTAMMRWASEVSDTAEQKSIIFTTFVTTLIISCAIFILALPFKNSIYSMGTSLDVKRIRCFTAKNMRKLVSDNLLFVKV